MDENKKVVFMPKLTKFIAILLAISSFVLALYIGSSIHVKNSIKTNLQPIIEDLKQDSGAESVDVKIYTEPDSYDLPWMVEFHVYLTANINDLRRLTDADALKILNNGVELGETEYSYDWDLLDYALYNRTVTDSVTGRTHPVFVTLSDGNLNYSIEEDSLFDVNRIYKKGAYETLQPPMMSQLMLIFLLSTLALLGIWGFLIYKRIQKSLEFKRDKEAQIVAAKKEEINLGIDNILQKVDEDLAKEESDNKKKNKNKIIGISAACVAVVALVVTLLITLVVIPTNKYNEAVTLRDSGSIDAAYEIFEELGNFKDCEELRNEIDYFRVDELLTSHSWKEAYLLLSKISGYKNSADIMKQLETDRPYLSILLAKNGDVVTLGEYEQDNNTSNGKEPIEWIVLHNEDGEVYLLSKYILDAQQFNTTDVKECSLDDWLKTTFSKNAFESINDDILTRVGILQEIDIDNYGMTKDQITAEYTKYALAQDPERGYTAGLMWWLIEDTLFNGGGHISAPVVWENGSHGNYSCNVTDRCGVRPAVWLFAEPDDIPAEPVFDGSAPTQWRPSGGSNGSGTGSNTCSRCGGSGRVNKHFGNSWNDKPGYGYGDVCGGCGGTGRN